MKLICLLFVFFSVVCSAQQALGDENNVFRQEEKLAEENTSKQAVPQIGEESGPGGPPGEVPINDYIHLLILTAAGIIAYSTYKKKSIN